MSLWRQNPNTQGKVSDDWLHSASKAFRELSVEVELTTPIGAVFLVPSHTKKRRRELTAEEALVLYATAAAFDGKVTGWTTVEKADTPPDIGSPDISGLDGLL